MVLTGLYSIDKFGGLKKDKVYLFYSRPYVGKTALALFISNIIISQGIAVIYIDTFKKLFKKRVLASISNISKFFVVRPQTSSKDQMYAVMKTAVENNAIVIYDNYFGLSNYKTILQNLQRVYKELNVPPLLLFSESRISLESGGNDIEPYMYGHISNTAHYQYKLVVVESTRHAIYGHEYKEIDCICTKSQISNRLLGFSRFYIRNGVVDTEKTLLRSLVDAGVIISIKGKYFLDDGYQKLSREVSKITIDQYIDIMCNVLEKEKSKEDYDEELYNNV